MPIPLLCLRGSSTLRINTKKSRWVLDHTAGTALAASIATIQCQPWWKQQQLTLEHLMAVARHGNLPGRMHPHPNCTKNAPKYPTSKKANFKGKKVGPAGNGVGRSRAWTTTRGILLMNRHRRAARKYTKVVTSQPTYPPTRHVPTPQKWGRIKGLCAFWTIGFPSRGCTTRGEIERWEGSFFWQKKMWIWNHIWVVVSNIFYFHL